MHFLWSPPTQLQITHAAEVSSPDRHVSETFCALLGKNKTWPKRDSLSVMLCSALATEMPQ